MARYVDESQGVVKDTKRAIKALPKVVGMGIAHLAREGALANAMSDIRERSNKTTSRGASYKYREQGD